MIFKRLLIAAMAVLLLITAVPFGAAAQSGESSGDVMPADGKLRRPISPEQPMWIVHIDTWNNADPDKIIDLIPEDILPYVVFNISLSVNWDTETKTWGTVQYGYETAKSWLRTCAERQVWAMIQPASGGQCHFPDYPDGGIEGTLFEEFFRDYPNFLGFNYCEQFWGFESEDFPISCQDRYRHFSHLLELTHKYGGYLIDSWCGNQWGQSINPLAMLKTVPEFAEAAAKYTENFILCEKYTQVGYLHDEESYILGAWLSGYSGQYGIRYDETGWTGNGVHYTMATGLAPQLERLVKSGLTVIDGPELVPEDNFFEDKPQTDKKGYSSRQWQSYAQFKSVAIDMFRKIIDGTIRIPSREEVIKNTKVAIIQDISNGTDDDKYCSYPSLFTGLYKMDNDGDLRDNHNFYKKTGRYPTIPTVYALKDDIAKAFEIQINQSEIKQRWSDVEQKTEEFNGLFPEEYSGDIYAGRNKNTWVVYNPLKNYKPASGVIPFKYNTADSIELTLSTYTTGIINEYSDHLEIYLNNFDNDSLLTLAKNTIKISGCSEEPELTFVDRSIDGEGMKCSVETDYQSGVFTATVSQNGPVDITINVKGSAKGRSEDYNTAVYNPPERPGIYYGDRQYEAELYDSKNIEKNIANGCRTGVENYVGQGYMIFGKSEDAAVRDNVRVLQSGKYNLSLRYSSPESDISKLALYVNGAKVSSLKLEKTSSPSEWKVDTSEVSLKKGDNTVELKANDELEGRLYLDCIIIGGERLGAAALPVYVWLIIAAAVIIIIVVVLAVVKKKSKSKKS